MTVSHGSFAKRPSILPAGTATKWEMGPILFLGNVPFASPMQRAQQLAVRLSEGGDLVYVEPNRSVLQRFRRKQLRPFVSDGLPLPRLRCFRPPVGFPGARSSSILNRMNYRMTSGSLKRFLQREQCWPPQRIIATFPDQLELVRLLPEVPVIYDLMDEPLLFARKHQKRYWSKLHDELLECAEITVTSSQVLLQRYSQRARQLVLITNGVSDLLFQNLETALPRPDLARLPPPRLGYVGMISHWFDFEAVRALASAYPQGTILLVGPIDCTPPPLPRNVIFTGPVSHQELAPVLRSFHMGLIPFRRCSAIDAVNPVKLYEYLAAGLPVLASNFAEMAAFQGLVALYEEPDGAVAKVRLLLAENGCSKARRLRREFAQQHLWSRKAEQYLEVLRRFGYAPPTDQGTSR